MNFLYNPRTLQAVLPVEEDDHGAQEEDLVGKQLPQFPTSLLRHRARVKQLLWQRGLVGAGHAVNDGASLVCPTHADQPAGRLNYQPRTQ